MADNCGNCRYFQKRDDSQHVGECRRFPPSWVQELGQHEFYEAIKQETGRDFVGQTHIRSYVAFPPQTVDGWCGEHRKPEAKFSDDWTHDLG